MRDDEVSPPPLGQGGGRVRTGGFGYLYNHECDQQFNQALNHTMQRIHLPDGNVFDAALTKTILSMLKNQFAEYSKPVHLTLQDKEGHQKMEWNGVSDTIRRFVFGIYERDQIPVYIESAVLDIEDPKWKAFLTQRLIVKHNHHTVQRCIDSHRSAE